MAQEALKTGFARALICQEDALERYAALEREAEQQGLPVYPVSARVLEAVTDTRTPQGVLCVCAMTAADSLPDLSLIAALENVQDPANVGTELRTMDAIGGAGVLLRRDRADVFAPKTRRSSLGAVFRVPVRIPADFCAALETLKARGCRLLAGALDGVPFYERPADTERTCLMIGNEGQGLTARAAGIAQQKVRLPMPGGAESLNAAVACAVMAYDVLRRRLGA